MEEIKEMIRIEQFAEDRGCTVRNVQIHIKRNWNDLKSHIENYDKKTHPTLLDEFAVEFLSERIGKKEVVLIGEGNAQKLAEAEERIRRLELELAREVGRREAAEGERVSLQRMLVDSEVKLKLLEDKSGETEIKELKAQIDDLSAEKEKQGQDLAEVEKERQKASEKLTEVNATLDVLVCGKWRERKKLLKELKKQAKSDKLDKE